MFIESSSPRSPGDNAILQSSLHTPVAAGCVQFYYNMFGANIGKFRVWVQPQGGAPVKLWELIGQQGSGWRLGTVPFSQSNSFQVSIF